MITIFKNLHARSQNEHVTALEKELPYLLFYLRNGEVYKTVGTDNLNRLFHTTIFKFNAYLESCNSIILTPINLTTKKLSHKNNVTIPLSIFCGFQWVSTRTLDAFEDMVNELEYPVSDNNKQIDKHSQKQYVPNGMKKNKVNHLIINSMYEEPTIEIQASLENSHKNKKNGEYQNHFDSEPLKEYQEEASSDSKPPEEQLEEASFKPLIPYQHQSEVKENHQIHHHDNDNNLSYTIIPFDQIKAITIKKDTN
ncbi:hypothetical protein [Ornithinibacillus californiensis]|uniref:hypothetical protein n=1 Tax=Ornithinibacillus californiensis TaxID=161536 RepID=UPI00064D87CC|nr:hypothetical protein [Ornithinibacillus californiensis]